MRGVSATDRIPFDRYAAVRRIGPSAYAPDGTRFAYIAPTSGRNQLWIQPTGGGFPTQATELEGRRVVGFTWVPEGDAIVFLADRDGDEMFQVFVLPFEDGRPGWPRQLTDAPQVQHQLGEALPGHRVLITANDREPTEMDAQILGLDSGQRQRLTHHGQMYAASASPDGRHALIVEVRGNMDQDLHVADLETGELRHVTPHEGEAQFWPGPWTRDGRGVYLRTDLDRAFLGVGLYDLDADAWRYVDAPDRDVEDVQLSRDGRTRVSVENDGGATRLRVYDPGEERWLTEPALPFGVAEDVALHPFQRTALATLQTPAHAPNLFELDLRGGGLQAREQSMLGGLDEGRMPTPELVHVPGGEVDIPAWLYRPRGDGPFPVLLSIHGGPETQERPTYAYDGLYAYLHERGVAVVAPNIRGSSGFGKAWQKAIHRDWGGVDVRDLTTVADWIASLPWVDASRIGVFGGSYGGFATLTAVTRMPERWSVAVDVVGPSNLVTFAQSVPPHWRPLMAALVGDPEDPEDRATLEERSPIHHVENVQVPMLIYQGANDPRVVQAESDQMVEALRARGLEVEYIVDEKSGHGPADRETALTWYRTIAAYLEWHLART